jgi:hypothetical protein
LAFPRRRFIAARNRDSLSQPSRLQRRHVPVRAVCPSGFTRRLSALPDSSHGGHFKDRPSTDVTDAPTSRLNRSSSFDLSIANTQVRSVHVDSHDFDGSLRTSLRVYCTPQPAIGFARFPTTAEAVVFPTGAHPSKLFPRRQLKTRHRASCPLVVVRVVR